MSISIGTVVNGCVDNVLICTQRDEWQRFTPCVTIRTTLINVGTLENFIVEFDLWQLHTFKGHLHYRQSTVHILQNTVVYVLCCGLWLLIINDSQSLQFTAMWVAAYRKWRHCSISILRFPIIVSVHDVGRVHLHDRSRENSDGVIVQSRQRMPPTPQSIYLPLFAVLCIFQSRMRVDRSSLTEVSLPVASWDTEKRKKGDSDIELADDN